MSSLYVKEKLKFVVSEQHTFAEVVYGSWNCNQLVLDSFIFLLFSVTPLVNAWIDSMDAVITKEWSYVFCCYWGRHWAMENLDWAETVVWED